MIDSYRSPGPDGVTQARSDVPFAHHRAGSLADARRATRGIRWRSRALARWPGRVAARSLDSGRPCVHTRVRSPATYDLECSPRSSHRGSAHRAHRVVHRRHGPDGGVPRDEGCISPGSITATCVRRGPRRRELGGIGNRDTDVASVRRPRGLVRALRRGNGERSSTTCLRIRQRCRRSHRCRRRIRDGQRTLPGRED